MLAWRSPYFFIILALFVLIGPQACSRVDPRDDQPVDGNASQEPALESQIAANESGAPTLYRFASPEEAARILTTEDEYTAELQPTEIGIKNRDATKTSLADLKENYALGIVPWTEEEKDALRAVIADLEPRLMGFAPLLPETVLMAKTSQRGEGGLSHTRANLILFGASAMESYLQNRETKPDEATENLKSLFVHELHHVLTRVQASRDDAYFALIGFAPCRFEAPESLRARRLTNPDAPVYGHYAPLELEDADGLIPYLTVSGPYSGDPDTSLGDYFSFGLLKVVEAEGVCRQAGSEPAFLSPGEAPGFFALIGSNTGYIIHPEETLADNFTFMIMEKSDLPNPEIPQAVEEFWADALEN